MKILYLEWNSYANEYIKKELLRRGYELNIFKIPENEDTRTSTSLTEKILYALIDFNADFCFSLNYYPTAAIACKAYNKKYVSWTYDSPYIQLYSRTIEYPTNYAFIFDKSEFENLKRLGVNRVFYLPMAAPSDEFDKIILSFEDKRKYSSDILMIGSMYTEKKHQLMRHFDKIDDYARGYIDSLINTQKNIFGMDIIEPALNDDIIKRLQKSAPLTASGDGLESLSWTYSKYFLQRELTKIERAQYLKALSEKYSVTLYTNEPTPNLPKVINKGKIDYYKEMPKAMKCAKLNLNITLRSIVTGIPLRAMDILAAGGFLLTSYQEDLFDFFEADKDFVYYDSLSSLMEIAGFYLSHEKERQDIALNGYEKAKKYHSLKNRFDEIEKIIFP